MNTEAFQAAALQYNAQLPTLAETLRACGSKMKLDAHVDEF